MYSRGYELNKIYSSKTQTQMLQRFCRWNCQRLRNYHRNVTRESKNKKTRPPIIYFVFMRHASKVRQENPPSHKLPKQRLLEFKTVPISPTPVHEHIIDGLQNGLSTRIMYSCEMVHWSVIEYTFHCMPRTIQAFIVLWPSIHSNCDQSTRSIGLNLELIPQ